MAKPAHEGSTHTACVAKSRIFGDSFQRRVTGLNRLPRGFQPEALDGLGWRRACLRGEGTREIARAHRGAIGKMFDGERIGEVSSHPLHEIGKTARASAEDGRRREL